LTGMERLAIEKEHAELAALLEELRSILADTKKVDSIISDELNKISEQYGDNRRTVIEESSLDDITLEDLIEDDDVVISVSHQGYAKRLPLDSYKAQKRGGKGVFGTAQKED